VKRNNQLNKTGTEIMKYKNREHMNMFRPAIRRGGGEDMKKNKQKQKVTALVM
jgi:hypothetical protein